MEPGTLKRVGDNFQGVAQRYDWRKDNFLMLKKQTQ